MSETREQFVRRNINERRQAIADGVNAADKYRMDQEILEFENELVELAKVRELPDLPTEPILAEIDGLPLESYTETMDGATMIRIAVESLLEVEKNRSKFEVESLKKIIVNGKADNERLIYENENLRDHMNVVNIKCEGLEAANGELTIVANQAILERDQAFLYRNNTVKATEDMAFEMEQMKIELNRNREVKAYTEAERTAQAEEARQRLINSRIKIYNVQWEDDTRKVNKTCNFAETGEPHTFNYLEHGKFTEITEDEALAIQAMNKPIEMPEVDEAEVFQGEDAGLPDVQQGTEQGNSGSQQQAIRENETFEQEVRRRLTALEESVTDIIG